MSRLIGLSLALLFVLTTPVAVAAQSDTDAGSAGFADTVIADVDAFWAGTFGAAGLAYESPGIVAVDAPVETACGPIDPYWVPGAYCAPDGTIYYSIGWYDQFLALGEDFAWVVLVAHEWGHHVQTLLGVEWTPNASFELQADCLAGAYVQSAEARGILPPSAVAEAVRLAALIGDASWLPADAPEHGSGAERAIAFMNGYQGGAGACGLPL